MTYLVAKYTPGPWCVNGHSPIGGILVSTANGVDICICDGPNGSGKAEANARLIAAAPDMLAALESACDAVRPFAADDAKDLPAWVKQARAAIAKAKEAA